MNDDTIGGYTIKRDAALKGWTLTDPDGDYRMIDGFGHVAPTYRAAVLERELRLADGAAYETVDGYESGLKGEDFSDFEGTIEALLPR